MNGRTSSSTLWGRYLLNRSSLLRGTSIFRGVQPAATSLEKRAVLEKWMIDGCDWVETGTYFGQMTRWLAKRSRRVISLEPEPSLYEFTRRRLRKYQNVQIRNSDARAGLGPALQECGDAIGVFLDGHFSGGITFRGDEVSPIRDEIAVLQTWLKETRRCLIFVDDFRLFGFEDSGQAYPDPSLLVDFAEAAMDGWTVQSDVFVAWRDG